MTAEWRAEHAQWYGKLNLLSDMHDLGSHRLHIYIERTLSMLLCFVLR